MHSSMTKHAGYDRVISLENPQIDCEDDDRSDDENNGDDDGDDDEEKRNKSETLRDAINVKDDRKGARRMTTMTTTMERSQ